MAVSNSRRPHATVLKILNIQTCVPPDHIENEDRGDIALGNVAKPIRMPGNAGEIFRKEEDRREFRD
jgi:hypothetical protein